MESRRAYEKTKKTLQKVTRPLGVSLVAVLVFCAILMAATYLIIIIPLVKDSLSESASYNIKDLANAESFQIEQAQAANSNMSADDYKEILGDTKLASAPETSYAYLLDKDGIMLFHPTESKIGQPVENASLKEVVKQLQAGKYPETTVVSYLFKGKVKYAGYCVSEKTNKILVISADESEVFNPINGIVLRLSIFSVIILLVVIAIGILFSKTISRPMKRLTRMVNDVSQLKIKDEPVKKTQLNRKDEIGLMSREVVDMKKNLNLVVANMRDIANSIENDASGLNDISKKVNSFSEDNSATSEELAAGMQETVATSETIAENVVQINISAEEIQKNTLESNELAHQVTENATSLSRSSREAYNRSNELYGTMKEQSINAIEQSAAIERINELSDQITDIASQTSLLSLNASIEAARAGEAGKGFAVVASEISNLASQSSTAVGDINSIVGEVKNAVQTMSECLQTMLTYLDETVQKDYNGFIEVGEQYNQDASSFQTAMNNISNKVDELNLATAAIKESISGINLTIDESADGVNQIAEATSEVVGLTTETNHMAGNSLTNAQKLTELVHRFDI